MGAIRCDEGLDFPDVAIMVCIQWNSAVRTVVALSFWSARPVMQSSRTGLDLGILEDMKSCEDKYHVLGLGIGLESPWPCTWPQESRP